MAKRNLAMPYVRQRLCAGIHRRPRVCLRNLQSVEGKREVAPGMWELQVCGANWTVDAVGQGQAVRENRQWTGILSTLGPFQVLSRSPRPSFPSAWELEICWASGFFRYALFPSWQGPFSRRFQGPYLPFFSPGHTWIAFGRKVLKAWLACPVGAARSAGGGQRLNRQVPLLPTTSIPRLSYSIVFVIYQFCFNCWLLAISVYTWKSTLNLYAIYYCL